MLRHDVERGFPFLPSGTQIVLDRQTQVVVLDNIRRQIITRRADLVRELRASGDVDLEVFLTESGALLPSVLRVGWSEIRREAGLPVRAASELESQLRKRVAAVAHVDDRSRRDAYHKLLSDNRPPVEDLSPEERAAARMLVLHLVAIRSRSAVVRSCAGPPRAAPALRDELREVIDLSFSRTSTLAVDLDGALADLPLQVHASYRRDEVLAALGWATLDRSPSIMREGVVYVVERNIDAFFVTLTKSEADYSPSTMYRDYPISRTLFHWESQSTTSVGSRTGRRYLDGSSTVLLFVRHQQADELGAAPYLFGPAAYVAHERGADRSLLPGAFSIYYQRSSSPQRQRSRNRRSLRDVGRRREEAGRADCARLDFDARRASSNPVSPTTVFPGQDHNSGAAADRVPAMCPFPSPVRRVPGEAGRPLGSRLEAHRRTTPDPGRDAL